MLCRGVRRLFGYDGRVVLGAGYEGRFLVVGDYGTLADFNHPAFEDVMDEQVVFTTFDEGRHGRPASTGTCGSTPASGSGSRSEAGRPLSRSVGRQ